MPDNDADAGGNPYIYIYMSGNAGPWLSGRKDGWERDWVGSPGLAGHPRRPGDPPRWERVLLAFRPRPIGFPAATLGPLAPGVSLGGFLPLGPLAPGVSLGEIIFIFFLC